MNGSPSKQANNLREQVLDEQLKAAVRLLLQAADYADAWRIDQWQFALEVGDLWRAGVNNNHLRWLLCAGYLSHGIEKKKNDVIRSVEVISTFRITSNSCFLLTPIGIEVARQQANKVEGWVGRSSMPCWGRERWELYFDGALVKKFRRQAPNQICILDAFEQQGWPPRIDNPLPSDIDADRVDRLRDAIKRLNREQRTPLLYFRGSGSGQSVLWEARAAIANLHPISTIRTLDIHSSLIDNVGN